MDRLTLVDDPRPAAWLAGSRTPFDQLVTFGPDVFEASARVRFIPDPTSPDQDESDAVVTDDHPSDLAQSQRVLHLLASVTGSPDDLYVCVWDGYSDTDLPRVPETSLVVLPDRAVQHRRYVLFRGGLDGIDAFATEFGDGQPIPPPAFVWPADHSWCFACDVDPHWAGLGATQAAVDALVADPLLDAVHARPGDAQSLYY